MESRKSNTGRDPNLLPRRSYAQAAMLGGAASYLALIGMFADHHKSLHEVVGVLAYGALVFAMMFLVALTIVNIIYPIKLPR